MSGGELRIGLDVGGTHTDAVVVDRSDQVVIWTKQPTSADVGTGIAKAIDHVLAALGPDANLVNRVMLGTTHGTNAVLERRNLGRVLAIRLGGPATESVPPLISWPRDLRDATLVDAVVLPGGHYVEGREITSVDAGLVRACLERNAGLVDAVAVTGVFSPAYRDQELAVGELIQDVLGDTVAVSLSHEIGTLGLLARENATVLNAALCHVATEVTATLREKLESHGIIAQSFFAQNDGTLVGIELAARYPVLTIGSGPANSIRGAAFLTGLTDALVADVGGTSTDLGVLTDGFPREATMGAELAKVRTNFRMPDILSVAVGGGTVVTGAGPDVEVGPASIGFRLSTEAYCFGGLTATLTDAATMAGRVELGTHRPPQHAADTLARALDIADARILDAIDSMRVGAEVQNLVVVGGGAFLIDRSRQGHSMDVVQPDHAAVANAVGVAVAPVSARWDTVVPMGHDKRKALADACEIATTRAIQAGADPGRVDIVEITETPVGYLPEPATRLRVRAAGPIGQTVLT